MGAEHAKNSLLRTTPRKAKFQRSFSCSPYQSFGHSLPRKPKKGPSAPIRFLCFEAVNKIIFTTKRLNNSSFFLKTKSRQWQKGCNTHVARMHAAKNHRLVKHETKGTHSRASPSANQRILFLSNNKLLYKENLLPPELPAKAVTYISTSYYLVKSNKAFSLLKNVWNGEKKTLLGIEGVLSLAKTHAEPILKSLLSLSKEIPPYNRDYPIFPKKQFLMMSVFDCS